MCTWASLSLSLITDGSASFFSCRLRLVCRVAAPRYHGQSNPFTNANASSVPDFAVVHHPPPVHRTTRSCSRPMLYARSVDLATYCKLQQRICIRIKRKFCLGVYAY
ncbi:hypothetical protein BDP81DRAFT_417988 [Colletotrichum phormii]|uniref:Secreted protein n=1 Tax=Colletotrichum phormii TaxID=359342 RepID=A0AAJ0A099_9PEZI|nr:uncharacterized protein BDP81DRAFT_417988 [Colletotrichum phormii]KAK1641070.1 hypothetical protein BDP81DRAFT_417988 [Colletotrichum phormii]